MKIYHTDVHPLIVQRLAEEFGNATNLLLEDGRRSGLGIWIKHYGVPSEPLFGFDKEFPDCPLVVNRDGSYHHLTQGIITVLKEYHSSRAYLHTDQHLDLDGPTECASFVGRIVHQLGIPAYILADALNTPRVRHQSGLLKLIKSEYGGFPLNNTTSYIVVPEIEEEAVYASADLDAFPSKFFARHKWLSARPDFSPDIYRGILASVLEGHEIIGADITGLDLIENGKPNLHNLESIKNLVDLIRFIESLASHRLPMRLPSRQSSPSSALSH